MKIHMISSETYSDYCIKAILLDDQDRDIRPLLLEFYELYAAEVRGKSECEHYAWCRRLAGKDDACIYDAMEAWLCKNQGLRSITWTESNVDTEINSKDVDEYVVATDKNWSYKERRHVLFSDASINLHDTPGDDWEKVTNKQPVVPDPSIQPMSMCERTNQIYIAQGHEPRYQIHELST